MNQGSLAGFRDAVGGKRSRFSKWCLSWGILLGLGSSGGCEIDCDQRYCDFVRAAAGGIFAWEHQCCLESGGPACEDRALRYQALAFGAPSMRMACEDRNWDRVGEIWEEVRRVLPAVPLRIILSSFCGFDIHFGENVATPFAAGDRVGVDVGLVPIGSSDLPTVDGAGSGRGPGRGGTTIRPRSAATRNGWVVRSGSRVQIDSRGALAGFEASGILSVIESGGRGDDLDEWCRTLHPEEFRLQLRGPEGSIGIDLDSSFPGNVMAFTEPDAGVLGVAVRIVMDLEGSLVPTGPFDLDAVFLQVPFRIEPDGGLRLGSVEVMDAFDLWPVHRQVEAYIKDLDREGVDEEDPASCALAARVVADHFLGLHASECGERP